MTQNTTGRGTAVITGAASTRGIGRALAGRLAAAGWALGLLDVDPEVRKTAAALRAEHGVAALGAVADIADPPPWTRRPPPSRRNCRPSRRWSTARASARPSRSSKRTWPPGNVSCGSTPPARSW
ncbi:SDR family oxidoreductase [Streptomyces sp. M19]